jgi:hypothetical protein
MLTLTSARPDLPAVKRASSPLTLPAIPELAPMPILTSTTIAPSAASASSSSSWMLPSNCASRSLSQRKGPAHPNFRQLLKITGKSVEEVAAKLGLDATAMHNVLVRWLRVLISPLPRSLFAFPLRNTLQDFFFWGGGWLLGWKLSHTVLLASAVQPCGGH